MRRKARKDRDRVEMSENEAETETEKGEREVAREERDDPSQDNQHHWKKRKAEVWNQQKYSIAGNQGPML